MWSFEAAQQLHDSTCQHGGIVPIRCQGDKTSAHPVVILFPLFLLANESSPSLTQEQRATPRPGKGTMTQQSSAQQTKNYACPSRVGSKGRFPFGTDPVVDRNQRLSNAHPVRVQWRDKKPRKQMEARCENHQTTSRLASGYAY